MNAGVLRKLLAASWTWVIVVAIITSRSQPLMGNFRYCFFVHERVDRIKARDGENTLTSLTFFGCSDAIILNLFFW